MVLQKMLKKKEHPCMVPFGNLDFHQQAKDVLFKSIVEALTKE